MPWVFPRNSPRKKKSMAFVNMSLLAGGLLVAIPVILHLVMRQRPKQEMFPALRFIQQRRLANQRRLQLRHWVLLALRCGAIGLLALALARPSVASGQLSSWITAGLLGGGGIAIAAIAVGVYLRGISRWLAGGLATIAAIFLVVTLFAVGRALAGRSPILGDQEAPVAAAIVIDTSPRMAYMHENRTRLAAAQELAQWLLRQLPAESELAIVDSRSGSGAFAADRAGAVTAIERLQIVGMARPIVEALESSVLLLKQKQQARKEIYVLTDLTAAAWRSSAPENLTKLLAANPGVLLYVIDVGAQRAVNVSLGEPRLSSDFIAAGSDLSIELEAASSGLADTRTIEVHLEDADPTLPIVKDGKVVTPASRRRGTKSVQFKAGEGQQVRFELRSLEAGLHHGFVRLLGEDGLALDNIRYFAVEVQPAWPVLIVAPEGVATTYLTEALAPLEFRESGRARFRCESLPQAQLATHSLEGYRAIALLDPKPLSAETWSRLGEFCNRGGGLAIFLGHNADPPGAFQDAAALPVLGGKLTRQTRTAGDVFFAPRTYTHPVLAAFRGLETSVPWNRFPVYYHWNLDALQTSARTVAAYSNGKPALVENRLGHGTAFIMTTPISDPPRPTGYPLWNELATGEEAWPCFMLVNEIVSHLAHSGQSPLNYLSGQTALLTNDTSIYPERYQLFTPLDQPQDVLARDGQVTIHFTDQPGSYRLRGQKDGPVVRGFAVNVPGEASNLARLEKDRLDEILGKHRYHLAKSRDQIDRAVGNDRVGSEFYPLIVALVAVALGLEHLLANRFYRRSE